MIMTRAAATMMRKYWHVINIGVQNTLVYRVNFLFRSVLGLVPLTATILLWRTIFEGRTAAHDIAGYTLEQMISYYLLVTVVDALTAVTEDDWQIAADIREGNISQFLLRPIDYLGYRLCLYVAGRLIYAVIALLPIALFILLQRRYFVAPPDRLAFGCFLVSVFLTGLLQFLISYTVALLSFWVLEVATFIFIAFAFEQLAGGHLFPLDILPAGLANVLQFTPFPYMLFFPVSIYLGQRSGAAMWQGLALQAGWVLVTYALTRLVWSRGVRKYSAFGG
jgi:ABC-2 type transport system permease protein